MSIVWLHQNTTVVALALMLVDGRVLTPAEVAAHFPDHPSLDPFRVRWVNRKRQSGSARRLHHHVPDIQTAPLFHDRVGQAGIDWYVRHGVRQELNLPLFIGEKTVGALSFYLGSKYVLTREKLDLAFALAHQAELALELTRLVNTDKAADLGHEREQAAKERAAQLERANTVLSHSVENFAIDQGPDAFLDAIMWTIASALDVDYVDVWHWQEDGYASLHRVLEGGVVLPGAARTDHPNAYCPVTLSDFPWTREVISADKQTTEIIPLHKREGFNAEQLAYFRARRARALIASTIRSGKKVIGSFSACLPRGTPDPGPERRALMRSLAAHGALALEMGRLTEAARVGAIREERTRIARDLHDDLAQGFTGIIVHLEGVKSALASGDLAKARARGASAGALARDSLQQARSAVYALRPSILEDKDLTTALRSLIASTFEGSPVEAEAHFHGIARPLSPEAEENLLRIAQEALTNVLKHARARHVCLSLDYRPETVILRVHDDGCGFKASSRRHGCLGLIGIRERADRLAATLTIKNRAGGGTSIYVKLPTPARDTNPR